VARSRRRLVRTVLCAALLAGGRAYADPEARSGEAEPPPAAAGAPREPAAEPPREGTPPESAPDEAAPPPKEKGWVDIGHAFVEQRLFAPILRFDRFFSDEREIEAERARSFLRWRSEMRLADDRSRPAFTTGVRATLRLPGLNKRLERLRVVIAGETRDAVSTLFPGEPGSDDPVPTADEDGDLGRGDAGVRFRVWESLVSHADLGGGILLDLPPGAYTRLRFRVAVPIGNLYLARSAVTGFWRTDEAGFGTTLSADLERVLSRGVVARLAGSGTLSEASVGVEWTGDLAVLASISARSGAQIGVAVNGASDGPRALDRPRAYTRFRRDFHRRWLFFEIEPEVAWPWTADRGRHAVWGLAFRLEVQFHGNEAQPSEPPAGSREPKDPPPKRTGALPPERAAG
jgi:hypothetical protein